MDVLSHLSVQQHFTCMVRLALPKLLVSSWGSTLLVPMTTRPFVVGAEKNLYSRGNFA